MARWLFQDQSGNQFEEDLGDQRLTDYLSAHGDLSPVKRMGDAPTSVKRQGTRDDVRGMESGAQAAGSENPNHMTFGVTAPTGPPKTNVFSGT